MLFPADHPVAAHPHQAAFALLERPKDDDIRARLVVDRTDVHHIAPDAAPASGAVGRAIRRVAALTDTGHVAERELRGQHGVIAVAARGNPLTVKIAPVPGDRSIRGLGQATCRTVTSFWS